MSMKKIKIITSVFIVLIIAIILLVALGRQEENIAQDDEVGVAMKCPDDYETIEEQEAALGMFMDEFFAENPQASVGDFAKARLEFYRQNNCEEALERYEKAKSGNLNEEDQKIMEIIDEVISEYEQ